MSDWQYILGQRDELQEAVDDIQQLLEENEESAFEVDPEENEEEYDKLEEEHLKLEVDLAAAEEEVNEVDSLIEEVEGYCGANPHIIRDQDFIEHIRESFDGAISRDSFLYTFIDWEDVANECEADYHQFEFEGETYFALHG